MLFSVIPIRTDGSKKPYITWTEWQEKRPDEEQIKQWWSKWPDANIGIITGKISWITVLDFDWYKMSPEEKAKAQELFPPAQTPFSLSPNGGEHRYFLYHPDLTSKADIHKFIDCKNDGGYIIAPPSQNSNGKYKWHSDGKIGKVDISAMPLSYINIFSLSIGDSYVGQNQDNIGQQAQQRATLKLIQGVRDQDLFHIANCLSKGGMTKENTELLLELIGIKLCNPPFPEKEIKAKIKSAFERLDRRNMNLTQEVREWVSATWGNFSATKAQQDITKCNIPEERKKVRVILGRLVTEGLIERVDGQYGVYRKVEEPIYENWFDADIDSLNIRLPFGMERYVDLYPGDIVVLAGTKSSGKTALAFEFMRLNLSKMDVFYHSSELVKQTFKLRISKSKKAEFEHWKKIKLSVGLTLTNAKDRVQPDALNVFDYLESEEGEFYKIPGAITKIHRTLKNGIAVVCLQKNRDRETAVGGEQTKAKANLYITLDKDFPDHVLRIVECKAFKDEINPCGFSIKYKIVAGINLIPCGILSAEE